MRTLSHSYNKQSFIEALCPPWGRQGKREKVVN